MPTDRDRARERRGVDATRDMLVDLGRGRLLAAAVMAATSVGATYAATAPSQPLPVIVTYELKRQHEAELVERRNPQAFWISQIVARIEEKKPAAIFGLKQPVTAKVHFIVDRAGRVVSKTIEKPSGVPSVDKEALAMLERAQPFPQMPATMGEKDLAFTLPLRFR